MMRFRAALFTTMLVAMVRPVLGSAPGVSIDFDHDAFGASLVANSVFWESQPLTNQYSPLGITVGGPAPGDGPAILDQGGNFGVNARSGRNFLAFNTTSVYARFGVPRDPVDFSFSSAISSFEIYVSGGYGATSFSLEAFDLHGQLLGFQNAPGPSGAYAPLTFASTQPIARIRISETGNRTDFVMDDLTFTPVPEPAAMVMTASGLLAIVRLRAAICANSARRRRQ